MDAVVDQRLPIRCAVPGTWNREAKSFWRATVRGSGRSAVDAGRPSSSGRAESGVDLDDDDELELDAVQRLRFYTTALLEGSITPDHVMEDWPDWHHLAPAFVAAYGAEELQELESAAVFLQAIDEQGDVSLTEADRAYLKALEA